MVTCGVLKKLALNCLLTSWSHGPRFYATPSGGRFGGGGCVSKADMRGSRCAQ